MPDTYIPRALDLPTITQTKSCFVWGPRQTGKSYLLRQTFPQSRAYNLLHSETFARLGANPQILRQELKSLKGAEKSSPVIIDEVQRLPDLLNEIHAAIEELGVRFVLTGSSARKLRRGGVNLLGGRARSRHLHPFTVQELPELELERALNDGTLPSIWLSDAPEEDLRAYVSDYLRQEVAAEGLTRNIPAFGRFLEVASLANGQLVNFTKIASDAQVPRTTIHEYYGILSDTLLATELSAWKKSRGRKPAAASKYYFFDTGVARLLQGRSRLKAGTPEFGGAFEAYLHHELRSYVDYRQSGLSLHHWRSDEDFEVDFILGDAVAIEVKAKRHVNLTELKGLRALQAEKSIRHGIVVTMEPSAREVDGLRLIPWREFLTGLWADEWIR
jgi:predicted AAA+ superfamily ATPase